MTTFGLEASPVADSSGVVTVTPTVTASSYAAGTVMGGLLTFANATRAGFAAGMVLNARVASASGIQPSLDLVLFSANPTGSTVTDHTALAVVAADLAKVLGVIHLTDVVSLGTPTVVQSLTPFEFAVASGTTLYGALVQRTSAGVTPGSTSDLTVSLTVQQQ